jgi:methionyl aminopeptidase
MGGKPAFPCNVSINEVAAHYTSPLNDKRTIPENSLVKIDIGVHIDGYIVDTAVTVSFNPEYDVLVYSSQKALKKAVEILRPGMFISQFGSAIQKTIARHGLKPISNLTGHKIERYSLHSGKSLPNTFHVSTKRVDLGEVYGVEPFVTFANADGRVESGSEAHIFRFLKQKALKNTDAKKLLNHIKEDFQALPFSERWLQQYIPSERYETAFSELCSSKSLMSYPVFVETSGKPVAQAEHTVLIVKDGCLVLT